MDEEPVAVVYNFCSNEHRFLPKALEEASLFAKEIVVVLCDHFFDGTPENRPLLSSLYAQYPSVRFIEYPFIPHLIPKKVFDRVSFAHFWHSLSRLIGLYHLSEEIEHVFFLDADEVPDGHRVAKWLSCSDYHSHTALRLANYWYFREPIYRASTLEDSIVLAKKNSLTDEIVLHKDEREAIYQHLPGPKKRHVVGFDGKPLFHHYSWVRTKEEMHQKVRAWGHKEDRPWVSLVEEEFSRPFSGRDFVHGYTFHTLEEHPLFPSIHTAKQQPPSLTLTPEETLLFAKKSLPPWWKRWW